MMTKPWADEIQNRPGSCLERLRALSGLKRVTTFARARDGVVSIEMALVSIFLASLALGAFDFGRVGIEKTRVTSAARAGAQYGIQDQSYAMDTAGMATAALADADATALELTVTPQQYCACSGGPPVGCSTTCADGAYAPMYVEVTVQGDVELMFSYPGVPDPITVSSTSTIRVR